MPKANKENQIPRETDEQRLSREVQETLAIMARFGKPAYSFKVGDVIQYNHLQSKIAEVYEQDGHVVAYRCGSKVIPWTRVFPPDNDKQKIFTPKGIYRSLNKKLLNGDIRSLIFKAEDIHGVNIDPPYQRPYVWDERNKTELIDAIWNDRSIGTLMFYITSFDEYAESGYESELIDGKQRFLTILDYVHSKLIYQKKYFFELNSSDRYEFLSRTFSYIEIQSNLRLSQRMEVFLEVNTSGVPQQSEHLDKVRQLIKEQ